MSFLDNLNRLINPLKKLVLIGPAHELFSDRSAVVSFLCQQTGNRLSLAADYVRENRIVYLMIDPNENCWKTLETGSTVNIWLEGRQSSGWAEGLRGYEEFLRILSQNGAKQQELLQRYAQLETIEDLMDLKKLQAFLNENKLIRVKLT
jgi:hypothetical protein